MSNVNHPKHYNEGKIEVIEFIEDKVQDDFHRGNAIKYIARAGKKDPSKFIEDLEKAIWYLNRRIEVEKGNPRRPNDMNPKQGERSVATDPQGGVRFDPKKHVDNAVYAYTTMQALNYLNHEDGKVLFSRRPPETAPINRGLEKVVFCKITPIIEEGKNGK